MNDRQKILDELVEVLKESEPYKNYEKQKQYMLEQPELKRKVDEYREKNFLFQQHSDGEQIFHESDRYLKDMEQLRSDPRVHEFLKAELAYCKMTQNVTEYILEQMSINFD